MMVLIIILVQLVMVPIKTEQQLTSKLAASEFATSKEDTNYIAKPEVPELFKHFVRSNCSMLVVMSISTTNQNKYLVKQLLINFNNSESFMPKLPHSVAIAAAAVAIMDNQSMPVKSIKSMEP